MADYVGVSEGLLRQTQLIRQLIRPINSGHLFTVHCTLSLFCVTPSYP